MSRDEFIPDIKAYQEQYSDRENKRFGCFFIIKSCFLVLLVLLIVGGAAGYKVYKSFQEGISLGISYTKRDFDDFVSAIDMELGDNVENLCFTCPVVYEGEQEVTIKLSSRQATAWIDMINVGGGYVSGTQVKFEQDKITIATDFHYQGQKFPVLISGNMERESNRSVSIDLHELDVGTIPMPGQLVSQAQKFLTGFTNDKLAEIDSFRMDKLEIGNGYLEFEGVIPETARGY